jgi:predicted RND superfamily exporter protein
MSQGGSRLNMIWNSYWFRLLVTGLPVGFIVGVITWISEFAKMSSIAYFVVLLGVLLSYGFLFDERYLEPWRRENVEID